MAEWDSCRRRLVLLALWLAASCAVAVSAQAHDWGEVATPSAGPPRVIGGPASGCIAGARQLPADGPGYQAIRLSRHRNYGHPETIAFVERLGLAALASGLPPIYVGDMAQPRGGPMSFGHGSHENGVDVDIWFNLDRKPTLSPAERETVELPLMVLADRSEIDRSRFGERQVRLLGLAARDSKVDRIFVHPTIKRALCRGDFGARTGDDSWLHKVRPWFGHDEHFHVRLACPADSPDCVGQAPVPAGDGCDAAALSWWMLHLAPLPVPTAPRAHRPVPAACAAVLDAP